MDFYRHRLAKSQWDWREGHNPMGRLRKNRVDGRAEKRGARQQERGDLQAEMLEHDNRDMGTPDPWI